MFKIALMVHLKKLKILEILKINRIKYIPEDLLKSTQKYLISFNGACIN